MKSQNNINKGKVRGLIFLFCLIGTIFSLQGCASKTENVSVRATETGSYAQLENEWGIRPESIRLSAAGHMLDFRYRVTDPEKAIKIMADQKLKTYLVDQASDIKLAVPSTPKIGSLRQTDIEPQAGRVYFSLFSNPGSLVNAGSKVTVVMGEFRAEDLVVQ